MITKHTPGPWTYEQEVNGLSGAIVTKTGWICDFVDSPSPANALLISAAPDLLNALQAMLDCCYDLERNDETIAAVKEAMMAIYKATGEMP